MPSTMMSTQQIFENPDFQVQLTEWQRSRIVLSERTASFNDSVVNDFGGETRKVEGPEDTVEYISEIAIEDFDDPSNWTRDIVSVETLGQHDLRLKANTELSEAHTELLRVGTQIGAGPFALWGVRNYLRPHTGDISIGALRERIKTAEDRFIAVDDLVRSNSGEVLTLMDYPMGFLACRLGPDGIMLEDRTIQFPIAEGSTAYFTTFLADNPKVYEDHSFGISADKIAATEPVILSPNESLDIRSWYRHRMSLLVGNVVSGPLNIPEDEGKDNAKYLTEMMQRLRMVTAKAAVQN